MNLSNLHAGLTARLRIAMHSGCALLILLVCAYVAAHPGTASANVQSDVAAPVLMERAQVTAAMPATVYFRGQSATIQGRNSAGIRFPDQRLLLTALVDTGGYATAIAQTYQAYLLTEVPLQLGDKTLPAGAYGYGFLEGDRMLVMDIGGKHLFEVPTTRDAGLKRPMPLQLQPAPGNANAFRLYLGRNFVQLSSRE